MAEVTLTNAARADMVEIRRYSIAEFGGEVADVYFAGFNKAFDRLQDQPLIGALDTDIGGDVRCMTHRRHRIFYRIGNDMVLVLRVIHHARNAQRALREL